LAVSLLIAMQHPMGMGFNDPRSVAQEVMGQYRWRMAMDTTMLTIEQERLMGAKPGSAFKECAHSCPVMIVIPPGKFIMGSPRPNRTGKRVKAHSTRLRSRSHSPSQNSK